LEISNKAMGAYSHDSSIERGAGFLSEFPSGADQANSGTFLIAMDLESQRTNETPGIYSGLSTIGQVVQFNGQFSAGATASTVVDYFAEYSLMLQLDMSSTQTWTASV